MIVLSTRSFHWNVWGFAVGVRNYAEANSTTSCNRAMAVTKGDESDGGQNADRNRTAADAAVQRTAGLVLRPMALRLVSRHHDSDRMTLLYHAFCLHPFLSVLWILHTSRSCVLPVVQDPNMILTMRPELVYNPRPLYIYEPTFSFGKSIAMKVYQH